MNYLYTADHAECITYSGTPILYHCTRICSENCSTWYDLYAPDVQSETLLTAFTMI